MAAKIAIGAMTAMTGLAFWASYAGWGLAKPVKQTKSVRHGSRHVSRGPYYHHFGRTHGHYHGK